MKETPTSAASQPREPNFIIVIGGMAAGKSTVARQLIREKLLDAILIDVDQFILTRPEYWELLSHDPENAYRRTYEQASHAAKKAMAEALARRLDIVWEVPFKASAMDQMLGWLKELGYRISLTYVDCSVEVARERANKRANDPNDPIHFHRDISCPPPSLEPHDFEQIRSFYGEAVARWGKFEQERLIPPGHYLDPQLPATFSPEGMRQAEQENDLAFRPDLDRLVSRAVRHVLYSPRILNGEIQRAVNYDDAPNWLEVQTWRHGEWWEGGDLVDTVRCAPPTPADKLLALGLPEEELLPGLSDDSAPKFGSLPELLSARTSNEPAVRVLVGPNVLGKRICRIVFTEDGKAVREEWTTDAWYRMRGYIGEVFAAPTATTEQLEEQRVPGGGLILGHKTIANVAREGQASHQDEDEEDEFAFTNWTLSVGRCNACAKNLDRPLFCCGKHAADGIAYCEECLRSAAPVGCALRSK